MNAAIIVGEHYDLDGMPVVVEAADQHEVVYRALNDQDAIDRGWGPTSYGTYEGMTTPASFARDAVMSAVAPTIPSATVVSTTSPAVADAPSLVQLDQDDAAARVLNAAMDWEATEFGAPWEHAEAEATLRDAVRDYRAVVR